MRKRALKQNNTQDQELGRVMLFGDFGGKEGEEVMDLIMVLGTDSRCV